MVYLKCQQVFLYVDEVKFVKCAKWTVFAMTLVLTACVTYEHSFLNHNGMVISALYRVVQRGHTP